jgi:hypothetical protein
MAKDIAGSNQFGEGFEESTTGKYVDFGGTDRTGKRKSDLELSKVVVVEVGGIIKGIFTGNTFETPNYNKDGMQKNYPFDKGNGETFVIGSRGKLMDQILKNVVAGQWVAFLYEGLKPSKADAKKEYKSVRIAKGQIDTAWLENNTTSNVDEASS